MCGGSGIRFELVPILFNEAGTAWLVIIDQMDPKDLLRSMNFRPELNQLDFRDLKAEREYEIIRSIRTGPQRHAENVQQAILAHIKGLQDKLAADEELLVSCFLGPEAIRVHQVNIPNWHVLILAGN